MLGILAHKDGHIAGVIFARCTDSVKEPLRKLLAEAQVKTPNAVNPMALWNTL